MVHMEGALMTIQAIASRCAQGWFSSVMTAASLMLRGLRVDTLTPPPAISITIATASGRQACQN